jgi:hypothetical protein
LELSFDYAVDHLPQCYKYWHFLFEPVSRIQLKQAHSSHGEKVLWMK